MLNLNDPNLFPENLEGKRHFFNISLDPPLSEIHEFDANVPDSDDITTGGTMKFFERPSRKKRKQLLMRPRRQKSPILNQHM